MGHLPSQALVRPRAVVQQGLGTPTEPSSKKFSIGIIRGLAVRSAFMTPWRSPTAYISAAWWPATMETASSRFRRGCLSGRHAQATFD